jgi:hypothetical protein
MPFASHCRVPLCHMTVYCGFTADAESTRGTSAALVLTCPAAAGQRGNYLDVSHMANVDSGVLQNGAKDQVIVICDRQCARVAADGQVSFPPPRADVVWHADNVSECLVVQRRSNGASRPEAVVQHLVVCTLQYKIRNSSSSSSSGGGGSSGAAVSVGSCQDDVPCGMNVVVQHFDAHTLQQQQPACL